MDDAAWAVAAGALTLGVVQTARLRWRAAVPGRRLRRMAVRAQAGEDEAGRVLERHGYRLVARQVTATWPVTVDGTTIDVMLRADYVVRRRGRTLVAEVKTGEEAPSITARPTRRQLLEYLLAFEADGVLLVDPEAGAVSEVRFAFPVRRVVAIGPVLLAFVVGAILAAGAVALHLGR